LNRALLSTGFPSLKQLSQDLSLHYYIYAPEKIKAERFLHQFGGKMLLKEIAEEIGKLWVFWSALSFIIGFLVFWGKLEPPTPETTMDYMIQLVMFVAADAIMSTIVGLLLGLVTKLIIEFLKDLGLW